MTEKKDNSSIFDNQTTIKTTAIITATSSHCCYQEDPLSTPPLSKCNHAHFHVSGHWITCAEDGCNNIIGTICWVAHDLQKMNVIIFPYKRHWTKQEIDELK